jgi:hypothetical protein
LLKKVLTEYENRGELTGVTAAAIFDEGANVYRGLEDWPLYEDGLGFYLQAQEKSEEILKELQAAGFKLQVKKRKVYSKDLMGLDAALSAFQENHEDLAGVLKKLAALKAPEKGTEIARLIQLMRKEEHSAHVDQRPARLEELKRRKDIEGGKFFKEFEDYSQSVKESLFRTDEERKLDRESRELYLLRKLAKLELTRGEWRELHAKPEVASSLKSAPRNDDRYKDFIAFYANAEWREEAMLKNLISPSLRAQRSNPGSCILVAGGFHTQGLIELFKRENISYLLVSPVMKSVPEKTQYQEQMRGEVSWKRYFRVENGKVNLRDAFARAARDRLLGVGADLRVRPEQKIGQAHRPAPTIKS